MRFINPDKCCWPACREDSEIIVEGKPLCDRHTALVMSESEKVCDQSRKKIGLKAIPVINMNGLGPDEQNLKCGVQGCPGHATIKIDNEIPVCSWHIQPRAELEKFGLKPEVEKFEVTAKVARVEIPDAPAVELEDPDPASAEPAEGEDWEKRFAAGEFD